MQQGIYPSEKVYLRLANGRVAAVLQHRILYRRFRASRHLLRKPPALCIDAALYDTHRALFDVLHFMDLDSGLEYRIPARVFDRHRFTIQRGDYPPQYACLLRFWATYDPHAKQEQLALDL